MRSNLLLFMLLIPACVTQAQPLTSAQTMITLKSSPGYSTGVIDFQVANMGGSDLDDVDVSIWALVSGQLKQVEGRKFGFIASGEFRQANDLNSPLKIGKIIVCLSYTLEGKRIETLEFWGNEHYTDPLLRDYGGRLQKFRSSTSGASLCKSMPHSAMQYLR